MLKELSLQNYRCHEQLDIRLRPLTVLLGENNTGKSAILEAITFLKKASLGGVDHLIPNLERLGTRPLGYCGSSTIGLAYEFDVTSADLSYLEGIRKPPKSLGIRLVIREKRLGLQELTFDKNTVVRMADNPPEILENLFGKGAPYQDFSGGYSDQQLLSWRMEKKYWTDKEKGEEMFSTLSVPRDVLLHKIQNMYYLSPNRYLGKEPLTPIDLEHLDLRDGALTSARMHMLHSERDPRYGQIERLITGLDAISVGVTSGWRGGPDTTVLLDTLVGQFDIEAMGDGFKKIIPCIVQSAIAPQESVVLIEEPELNLHPKAIEKVMQFFIQKALDGQQIVMSSHSADVVYLLWRSINQEETSLADNLMLLSLEKDEKGKRTVKEIELRDVRYGDILHDLKMFHFQ